MARASDDMDPRPTRPVDAVPTPEAPGPDGPRRAPVRKRAPAKRAAPPSSAAPAPARQAPPAKRAPAPAKQAKRVKAAPATRGERKAEARPVQPARRPRRLRHTIQKVDLWSVLKLSLCFYLAGLAVVVVALVALWGIADTFGIVANVEDFIGELLSSDDFTFLSGEMLRGVVLVGLVLVMLQVVITVMAAAFFNLFATLFGGLEVTVTEEDVTAPS